MGDLLYYRIPGESVVIQSGLFNKVHTFDNVEGFVLSSFDKNEKFVFKVNQEQEECHYSAEPPICIDKEEYLKVANSFLNELSNDKLSKAVFSRVKKIRVSKSPNALFELLCISYPNAFVYLVSSSMFGTWIGATPEKLIDISNGHGKTMALAGTLNSDDNSIWGEKERLEQQYVTDFIENKLEQSLASCLQISETTELIAGPVKHLVTYFEFDLDEKGIVPLLNSLHPTPAVSGLPSEASLELISRHEKHDRALYAGIIGFMSKERTNLFVNLRCAQLIHDNAYLYVGGGFTKDSNCESEWNETESKSETLQKVFEKN